MWDPNDPADFDDLLINAVRDRPCLWDKRHKDHKVNTKRVRAWKEVSVILNNMPVELVKDKWRNKKDAFTREKRKRKKPSGAGRRKDRPWVHYEAMIFLDPVTEIRRSVYT